MALQYYYLGSGFDAINCTIALFVPFDREEELDAQPLFAFHFSENLVWRRNSL